MIVMHCGARRLLRAGIAALAIGGALGIADARAATAPTLNLAENFVVFDQHATLTGTASTARVTLLARRFGQTAYSKVSTATVRGGAFRFSPVPILATRYEVLAGTGTVATAPHSRAVQVYVHLDAGPVSCNLCHPGHPVGHQTLRLAQTVRVPAPARRAILTAPTYVYVGTAATGKVQSLRRMAKITPQAFGRDAMRLRASVPVDLPASGKFRYLLCGRADEPATGVGLPSVHDCGEPTLNRGQFKRYVG
jgi:hypothetical protein